MKKKEGNEKERGKEKEKKKEENGKEKGKKKGKAGGIGTRRLLKQRLFSSLIKT